MIALIGNTGSGKTTLARALETTLNLPRISSGDIARQMSKDDPATRISLSRGDYAEEGAMRAEVRRRLEAAWIKSGGYILDGFPRRIDQLVLLMQWVDVEPLYVLVDTDPHTCVQRLVSRGREDDIADGIARKLQFFATDTTDMIKMLARSGALRTVDGTASLERQVEAIKSWL